MPVDNEVSRALDADISMTHERLVSALAERLHEMGAGTKERYFAILTALVTKLETPEKTLRDVLREVVAESAGVLFAELGRDE